MKKGTTPLLWLSLMACSAGSVSSSPKSAAGDPSPSADGWLGGDSSPVNDADPWSGADPVTNDNDAGANDPGPSPSDPQIPPGDAPSPTTLPLYWAFFGDSHTAGRETIESSASPSTAFRNIWSASGFATPTAVRVNGVSGRSLAGTTTAFSDYDVAATPWIHTQESGNQNLDGQRTPQEFGDTFEAYWRAVEARYPGSLKTYETAHSFLRIGERWRDWQTTTNWADWGYAAEADAISYNDEMLRRVARLADDGIVVTPVYTASYIDALIAQIPGGYPTIEMDGNAYHYNGIGNFMIALATFKALGYDVNSLDLSTVTVDADDTASATYKALCLEIANTLPVP